MMYLSKKNAKFVQLEQCALVINPYLSPVMMDNILPWGLQYVQIVLQDIIAQ